MKAYELARAGLEKAFLGGDSNVVKLVSPAVEKQLWENNAKTDKFSHYAFEIVLVRNKYAKVFVACERPNSKVLNLRPEDLGADGIDVKLIDLQISINYKNEIYARCSDVVICEDATNQQVVNELLENL